MWALQQIQSFNTDAEFSAVQRSIGELVTAGKLKCVGLIPEEPRRFIERYVMDTGETWLLAHPDQAFRGYLHRE